MTKQEFQEIIKEKAEEQAYDCDAGLLHGYLEGADFAYDLLSDGWIEIGELCQMPNNGQIALWYNDREGNFLMCEYRGMGIAGYKADFTHWILPQNILLPPNKTKQ